MIPKLTTRAFPPVGRCIYCGASNTALTTEHIVPYGLGGEHTLKEASCKACEKVTAKIERYCLRKMFRPFRSKFQFQTRRKKDRLTHVDVTKTYKDGTIEQVKMPLTDFPVVVLGYELPGPGILRGVTPKEAATEGKGWLRIRFPRDLTEDRPFRMTIGEQDWLMFSRMLAKIGHGWAVATCGIDNFRPILLELIFGRDENPQYFIGGKVVNAPPPKPGYFLGCARQIAPDGLEYFVMVVRLFGFFDAPCYSIVVGQVQRPLNKSCYLNQGFDA